ncbi:MAG: heme exporter protein CcmB [Actinomycetota bacterium]|nr:heme exporter protein CcmB [Actinomycetota bacterium]
MRRILTDIWLIASKDLKIEMRSRVLINQVAPFALIILVLFGIALDADQKSLKNFAPGLFWISVLLCALMAIARSMTIERDDGALIGLNLSGVDPSGIFLGKACAIAIQLLVLEVFLGVGIILLYGSEVEDLWLLISTGLFACIAVSALGTIFGFLASGLGVRETLLPILLLPLLLPLLIGASRAFDDALGVAAVNGWNWFAFVAGLTVILTGVGVAANYFIVEN